MRGVIDPFYLKVLCITGGASGPKRNKTETIAYDFKISAEDSGVIREALTTEPCDLKTFMLNISDAQFIAHFAFVKEQKNMDRILLRFSQEMPIYEKIGELLGINLF